MNIFIWVLQDLFYGFLFKKKNKIVFAENIFDG